MKHINRSFGYSTLGVMLLLLVAACSPSTAATATQAGPDLGATQAALEATQAALSAAQTDAAQQAEEGPTEAPTAEQATAEPTVAAPEDEPFYTEEFSVPPESWTYILVSGEEADLDLHTQNDRLVFEITGENVWPYLSYNSFTYTDVRLDTRAENLGNNKNNITLYCRANDDGWYEASVENGGPYRLLRFEYDTAEFTLLYSGTAQSLRQGKETNDFTLICAGDRLTLAVNGVEVRTVEDSLFDSGYVGISVASFDRLPVHVEFDYVTISEP